MTATKRRSMIRASKIHNIKMVKAVTAGRTKSGTNAASRQPVVQRFNDEAESHDAVFTCRNLDEWLLPQCEAYRGMRALRPQNWVLLNIQHHAEELYNSGAFGDERTLLQTVYTSKARGSEQLLQADLSKAAKRLLGPVLRLGLPGSIVQLIQRDAEEIGMVVSKLVPSAEKLLLKLELMKDNCCFRWHQDNYVARAIVTYNCSSTQYIHHDHVDIWELNNCGNNDHVVPDRSYVSSVGVGNILFIKGKKFPHGQIGLVHRSPDYAYYDASGEIKTRLCLKIDVE